MDGPRQEIAYIFVYEDPSSLSIQPLEPMTGYDQLAISGDTAWQSTFIAALTVRPPMI